MPSRSPAAAALEFVSGALSLEAYGCAHRYHARVFLTPPWPELVTW
ncbi:hypothetical protein [Dongia sedimenti]|uniref:Uncharacterized protein n=1 Tax=Dongia sedimenti TaxID=3064282 RepID=A0ABU0YGE2_9PROT|nr:hypothetical protein [Rhodospirillaceae bacterium R-7]